MIVKAWGGGLRDASLLAMSSILFNILFTSQIALVALSCGKGSRTGVVNGCNWGTVPLSCVPCLQVAPDFKRTCSAYWLACWCTSSVVEAFVIICSYSSFHRLFATITLCFKSHNLERSSAACGTHRLHALGARVRSGQSKQTSTKALTLYPWFPYH